MLQKLDERVDVIAIFTKEAPMRQSGTKIYRVRWKSREYNVTSFGLHHLERRGSIIHHVFSVSTKTLKFTLVFNSKTLVWMLEEVSDATPYLSC